ncbi:MAG: hypothetical protein IJF37_10055 [Lachnospiraceae bacterium]|nr:hypothetical protein [Lachnospiraceae bacterium]
MEKQQMNKPGKKTAILGFLLTFLIVLSLILGGVLISLKTTLLKGGDINEILENTNVYGTITDVVTNEITNGNEDFGLSEDAVSKVFSEDVLKDATKTMTEAIKNNEDIDISGVKDQCMDVVTEVSEQAVDDILDEIKESSDVVSVDVLKQNSSLQQLEADYNVDITTVISDYVEDTYGTTTVNIADVDIEQIRTEAKESLKETVIPTIEETVDKCIVQVNEAVNKEIKEANEEYDISGVINKIEGALDIITVIMIITIVISIVFAILQITVVYRKRMNRGFRNVSIGALISGIIVAIFGIIINILKGVLVDSIGGTQDSIEKALVEFVEKNIGAVSNRTIVIGVVYIVIAAACMAVAIVFKKRTGENDIIENNN